MRVLIADEVDPVCGVRLRAAGFEVDEKFGVSYDALKGIIGSYDILIVRSRTKVTREIIERGKNLRAIGRVGVGLDTIDVKAAEEAGIKILNTPQMSTVAVAELVMGMMLGLARKICLASESMKKGLWEKKKLHGIELKGKTLGVVGFGRIGRAVAERSRAFGMNILVYDVVVDENALTRVGGERVSKIGDLLQRSDVVTVHVPLIPETYHMFGEAAFSTMRHGSFFINASRGEVVDTGALLRALKSGMIAGAAIDVFEHEPPETPEERELVSLPNVIATPHIGAQTREAQLLGAELIAENIINAFKPL
ncbi:MAG: D-2-hydroxyacid dehydrogenase [Candidatus Methanosuratus sp.]|nr:D-2-hydroxyacid dehydrogenase [Candidatus Methanosuratincola sp.]